MHKRQSRLRYRLICGVGRALESRVRWGRDPPWEGTILGKGSPTVKYGDFLSSAVQKWLNRSICCLGCGLGWAKGSTCSIVFTRWRQCAHIGAHLRYLANTTESSVSGGNAVFHQITLTTCYITLSLLCFIISFYYFISFVN